MSYQFNSIVNRDEANALKEMIFNRVRERSHSMTEEAQSEVMDLARSSFVSENNPFSKIVNQESQKVENTDTAAFSKSAEVNDIGFPQREVKTKALNQNHLIGEQIASAAIQANMNEARAGLVNKKSFMGALNFLNSQAAVSLIKTRADRFEMVV